MKWTLPVCIMFSLAVLSPSVVKGQAAAEMGGLYGKGFGFGGGLGTAFGAASQKMSGNLSGLAGEQLNAVEATAKKLFESAKFQEKAGKSPESAKLYKDFADFRSRYFGGKDKQAGDAYQKAGAILYKTGKYGAAEESLRQSLAVCARRNGPGAQVSTEILKDLGAACLAQEKWKDSISFYSQALTLTERAGETKGASALAIRINLADAYAKSNNYALAAPLLKQAADLADKGSQAEKNQLPSILDRYAETLKKLNKSDEPAASTGSSNELRAPANIESLPLPPKGTKP